MKQIKNLSVGRFEVVVAISLFVGFSNLASSQGLLAQDGVYQFKASGGNSKTSGKITEISPDGVMIAGKLVPASKIARVSFSREPSDINRARDQMETGRFSDAIESLGKIDVTKLTPQMKAEVDFIRAFSMSQSSLRGGGTTPQEAGAVVTAFIDEHPASWHLHPAVEQLGKLYFAIDRTDLAIGQFEKLTKSSWPRYRLNGSLQLGMLTMDKPTDANAAFDSILNSNSNDDVTQLFKLLAKCQKARLAGIEGDSATSLSELNEMIATENSDKKLVFAHLYNALGAVHQKNSNWKEARTAYLHTDLLFATESELHAEALFHLSKIWAKLDETDRAAEARDTLKSRYRNSYWAGKL
jgi:tetratricopeptide (TPR) repeat protein